MCPPVSAPAPANIGVYWTDEEVSMYLLEHARGSAFPLNVLTDVNPYQYHPSALPDDIWYYRRSEEKKIMEHGFWKAKGEACEIFANSYITGWRTTLAFYEGQAPHGRKTDWVMQEYRITRKSLCKSGKPKESGSLCRVFLSTGQSSNLEEHHKQGGTDTAGASHLQSVPAAVPHDDNTSGKGSVSESQVKNWDNARGPLNVAEKVQNFLVENLHENDYISRGDYLALDDLADSESHSSSSGNSSCMSLSSDECFDAEALLQVLDDNPKQDLQGKDANLNFSVSASVKPSEVVMRPATLESLISGNGSKPRPERPAPRPDYSLPGLAIAGKIQGKGVPKHATTKSQKADRRSEGTSNSCKVAPSSSSHKAVSEGKKKVVAKKKKPKRNYLCCFPF